MGSLRGMLGAEDGRRDPGASDPGSTLAGVAFDHGTTWPRLFERNRDVIDDPDLIYPGDQLDV